MNVFNFPSHKKVIFIGQPVYSLFFHSNPLVGYVDEQVFQVKKNSWSCCPNSKYSLSSVASQDTTTCQNNATTYAHTESKSTQFHSGRGTQTQIDCAYIFLSLNVYSFQVVPNNLASHAHIVLTSQIVFLHFQTQTQLRMQWHAHTWVAGIQQHMFSQGRREFIPVQTALVIRQFSLRAKLSHVKHNQQTLEQMIHALTKLGVCSLFSVMLQRLKVGRPQTNYGEFLKVSVVPVPCLRQQCGQS